MTVLFVQDTLIGSHVYNVGDICNLGAAAEATQIAAFTAVTYPNTTQPGGASPTAQPMIALTGPQTSASIQAAITAMGAAGGGTVQLPAGTILLSTPLIPVSGVKLKGVPPQLTYSSIPDAGNNTFANGTVLTPTGAFAAISWNTTVLGTPASQAAFSQSGLTNIAFEDLGFSGGSHGIFAGATNNASCWWSQFKNLYFIGQTVVGLSLTNYQHCQFFGNYSFGCAWGQFHGIDVASASLAPGNSTYYDLYCVNPVGSGTASTVSRNITFLTTAALAAAADNNQFKMDRIQSNRFGGSTITQACTMTNAQATFTVIDGTKFAVGMPVTFSATANGFTTNLTYFVASVAANVISVATTYGGAAQNATGSTAVNVITTGFPCFEMIALANSAQTNIVIDNLDVEGLGSVAALFQNCTGVKVTFSQVPGTAQAAFSLCTRGCAQVIYEAPQSINTDIDSNSSGAGKGVFFFGSRFGSNATGSHAGLGIWLDTVSGKSSLGLGCQFNSTTAADLTWDPGTAGGFLAPRQSGIGLAPTKLISGSLSITNLNLAYQNTTGSAVITLPSVVAANVGCWLRFHNNTGSAQTINTDGTQLFNNVAGRTGLTLNDKASVSLWGQNLSGSFTWVIDGASSAMAAGVISAPT